MWELARQRKSHLMRRKSMGDDILERYYCYAFSTRFTKIGKKERE
jgi:hypothetical protein